jgi:hypothetical protein
MGRHDSHDGVWPALEQDRAPDRGGIGAEAFAPERVAQNGGGGARLVVIRLEGSTDDRLDTQQLKELAADSAGGDDTGSPRPVNVTSRCSAVAAAKASNERLPLRQSAKAG